MVSSQGSIIKEEKQSPVQTVAGTQAAGQCGYCDKANDKRRNWFHKYSKKLIWQAYSGAQSAKSLRAQYQAMCYASQKGF